MRNLIVFTAILALALLGSVAIAAGPTILDPNVGIGTTSPAAGLHVQGNTEYYSEVGLLRLSSATNPGKRLVMGFDNTNDIGYILAVHGGEASKNLALQAVGGNVGIGTISPAARLHVQGDSTYYSEVGLLQLSSATNPGKRLVMGFDNTNDIGYILAVHGGVANKNLALQAAGGNVGIGTISPLAKLDVAGDVKANGISVAALQTAVTTLQSLVASISSASLASDIADNAEDIASNQAAIEANDAKISALQDDLADLSDDLVDAKADLQAQIDALVLANATLTKNIMELINNNTAMINANTADIAKNLSYIKYIEDALSAPGASGISRYQRITTTP